MEKRLRIIVCGVGFGQFYIRAIDKIKCKYKLVGILSRGSEWSKQWTKKYGVILYTDIDEITWPDSIKLFLEDFYRDFYLGKKMDSNAQFLISVCQAWKDLGNSIGSANIIHAYTTKPIKISEIVK